ncbi:D-2-hydroxyacid dehydrogenase [Vagococcus salmoninarum]|uniref:Lactate dehydrogenase n=1 Tax=Vagococcus salmoninarum TaxID=2739 RepID=A0A429ZH67_9ENTE|nr:D-2-hydroxyacid dehydrogenase [Vagococcus salmoninarum]MBE9389124.1 D-2-hydroxyacid dehydrogenase [Vagococcus salmoninarum]RST93040.1 lactate dehydrogenase [Vagococcus salmoninarum]
MKLLMMGARDDERIFAEKWAQENNVELEITSDFLNAETLHLVAGKDGLALQQTMALPIEMYQQLADLGIKQIATRSAGYDMYDLEAATAAGLIITNVPEYSPNAIAEFAVTSALASVRQLNKIQNNMAKQDYRWAKDMISPELRSMTIGIIGTGRIGRITAQILKGFGANIIAYDLYQNEEAKTFLTYKASVEDVVKEADLISIHMPATKDNHHLFNDQLFSLMKDGSYLVNTARGVIVDTAALIRALDSGKLAGAALDTYENEMPYVTKDFVGKEVTDPIFKELVAREDVIFTPHIAFYTHTAVENLVAGGLNAVYDVITTNDSPNRVN